jgi:hypothetical protein
MCGDVEACTGRLLSEGKHVSATSERQAGPIMSVHVGFLIIVWVSHNPFLQQPVVAVVPAVAITL